MVEKLDGIEQGDTVALAGWVGELAECADSFPDEAFTAFDKAAEKFPDSLPLLTAYGWFISRQGMYERALDHVATMERKGLTDVGVKILKAFTLMKAQRYEEAEKAFLDFLLCMTSQTADESNVMYFLFLLCKRNNFDYGRVSAKIEEFKRDYPALETNGLYDMLKRLNERQISQIYSTNRHRSGFILFIDLVNSTQYKKDFPEHWRARTIHFLMYTRYAFKFVGFDFIKFIGDEVMMFYPFNKPDDPAVAAKKFYDFVFGRDSWYPTEANRFNPSFDFESPENKSPHELKVKTYIGEVKDALLFSPNADSYYDLIGEDVDKAARIKEMGMENLVIADDGFRNHLAANGGLYATAFDDLRSTHLFKGFNNKINFYGRFLGQR